MLGRQTTSSHQRVGRSVVVGLIRIPERLQIEGVKFCRLRDKRLAQGQTSPFHPAISVNAIVSIFCVSRYDISSTFVDPSFRSRCIIDISYSLSRKLLWHFGKPIAD